MTPKSTNARRNIDNFASLVPGNGARIRNLRAESSRNQVSLLILVHLRWGYHDGGTNAHPGPAKPDAPALGLLAGLESTT